MNPNKKRKVDFIYRIKVRKTYITVFSRIGSAVQSANLTRVNIALREKPVTQVKKNIRRTGSSPLDDN